MCIWDSIEFIRFNLIQFLFFSSFSNPLTSFVVVVVVLNFIFLYRHCVASSWYRMNVAQIKFVACIFINKMQNVQCVYLYSVFGNKINFYMVVHTRSLCVHSYIISIEFVAAAEVVAAAVLPWWT